MLSTRFTRAVLAPLSLDIQGCAPHTKLPSDCIVYYEQRVRDRHPDFVSIIPKLGLLVIEVKGWKPGSIKGGDHESVLLEDKGVATRQAHPLKQARGYLRH